MSEDLEYNNELYHAMCNTLWQVVGPNGQDDCATLAAARIRALETELAECREAVRVLGAEVRAWRKVDNEASHADAQARMGMNTAPQIAIAKSARRAAIAQIEVTDTSGSIAKAAIEGSNHAED